MGFKPGLKVEVTMQDGLLHRISNKENNEVGAKFYLPVFDVLLREIVDKQTTQVDVISRATYSSKGIIEAVENFISKAIIS